VTKKEPVPQPTVKSAELPQKQTQTNTPNPYKHFLFWRKITTVKDQRED
jgi:hypothetical protein